MIPSASAEGLRSYMGLDIECWKAQEKHRKTEENLMSCAGLRNALNGFRGIVLLSKLLIPV